MAWSVEFTKTAEKQLKKLDKQRQAEILDYLEDEVAVLVNPRTRGKALVGNKHGLWRYRIGDYRVICDIRDAQLVLLAVTLGHRREVYD